MNKFLIVDFDSTLIQVEALDELAALALNADPGKTQKLREISAITNLGMEGKISIEDSLEKRLALLNAGKAQIDAIIPDLKEKISSSFKNNQRFFRSHRENIFIISNGFKDYILPVTHELHIKENNVFANTLLFDASGKITGYDKDNILARANGKSRQLQALGLKGEIYVIGDGYTDYQMTETGLVTKFFCFTENVERPSVTKHADHVIASFDEFLAIADFPA